MLSQRYTFLMLFLTTLISCKKPVTVTYTPPPTIPFLAMGNQIISKEEFENAYLKGEFAPDSGQVATPEEYFTIYTNARLKILKAQAVGIDTTTEYKDEIESFRNQLAKNYSVDQSLVEKMSQEAYQHLKYVVRASHILIQVPENASPVDTLAAYRAAIALHGRLMEGSDFREMAFKYSNDPTAKTNEGDLGYFTAFQMIYPIENEIYKLKIGEISYPVRSKSGYHILKLTDKKVNPGVVQIAHIMTKPSGSVNDATENKINEAYAKLQNGESWKNVLSEYSDDLQSKKNDGLLSTFGVGQMVSEIEEAAFSLSNAGDYSKPIKTTYGWHIVKLIEKRPIESYENLVPTLKDKVLTDTRKKVYDDLLIQKLQSKFKVTEYPETIKQLNSLADSTLLTGFWDYVAGVTIDWSQTSLFSIENKTYYVLPLLNFIRKNQQPQPKGSSPAIVFRSYYQQYLADRLQAYNREILEETDPEFKSQMKEIRDGVLISKVMEENVWGRSLSDSLGQEAFYNKNKEKYHFPERAWGLVVSAPDTLTLGKIKNVLSEIPYKLERKSPSLIFGEKKSEVDDTHLQQLGDLLIILGKNPNYMVEVAGYSMPSEPEIISAQRIRNVVNFLVSKKIPLERILEKDYGSYRLSNVPEENRQVGFQFFSKSKPDLEKVLKENYTNEISITEGYFSQKNPLLKNAKWIVGSQQITDSDGTTRFIHIERVEPERIKTLNEARGSVINDFQKELEINWTKSLQEAFPIKVDSAELEKIKP